MHGIGHSETVSPSCGVGMNLVRRWKVFRILAGFEQCRKHQTSDPPMGAQANDAEARLSQRMPGTDAALAPRRNGRSAITATSPLMNARRFMVLSFLLISDCCPLSMKSMTLVGISQGVFPHDNPGAG